MVTVLIIHEEFAVRALLSERLERYGFIVLRAADGKSGLQEAKANQPDIIILDIMMPDRRGLSVCKLFRESDQASRIPIVMLTQMNQKDQEIEEVEAGADEYLIKPFELGELALCIKKTLRKTMQVDEKEEVEVGPFHLDKNNSRFKISGEDIDLTLTEFQLLLSLIEIPGAPLERGELLERVWGYSNQSPSRTVDTHIKRLRAKLGKYRSHIETVHSVGYRFNEN